MIDGFLETVAAVARAHPDVRAALLIGSHARSDTPADEWSDVDIVLVVDDAAALAAETEWLRAFGEPELTFLEPTAVGGQVERRVLFADGLEVDFALLPTAAVGLLHADPAVASVLARGHRVLHDELGLPAPPQPRAPSPRDGREIAHDFWYHALWTAKKHRRGEHATARFCLECTMKARLLELARAQSDARDTWHGERFVERWADARAVAALWTASASRPEHLPGALRSLCDAFDELRPPDAAAASARRRLEELLR